MCVCVYVCMFVCVCVYVYFCVYVYVPAALANLADKKPKTEKSTPRDSLQGSRNSLAGVAVS